jgi:hypothetical protein
MGLRKADKKIHRLYDILGGETCYKKNRELQEREGMASLQKWLLEPCFQFKEVLQVEGVCWDRGGAK